MGCRDCRATVRWLVLQREAALHAESTRSTAVGQECQTVLGSPMSRALPFLEWWQPSGMNVPTVPPTIQSGCVGPGPEFVASVPADRRAGKAGLPFTPLQAGVEQVVTAVAGEYLWGQDPVAVPGFPVG